ncbi:MAG: tetratricopeptide repeat protein [Myxococcota bacterium]
MKRQRKSRRGDQPPFGRRLRAGAARAILLLFACAATAAGGPLHEGPGAADPLASLTPAKRAGAKALGMARIHLDAGRLARARETLVHVRTAEALAGYAELLRVRILIAEGRPDAAVEAASSALEDSAAAQSAALRAALGVLRGEALAMQGDASGAELAWSAVLGDAGPEETSVRESIQLAIVSSRQRSGSLEAGIDPRVLLDRHYADVAVATERVPASLLAGPAVLDRADAALEAGHPEEARQLFETAIGKDLDPAQARSAKMGRARALFRARKYASAAKAYGALLPDVEARFWRARSLARSGDVDGALAAFARVAESGDAAHASWALYLAGTLYEDRA